MITNSPDDLKSQTAQEPESQSNGHDALKACQAERATWQERALRLTADFENFKKRTEKEKIQWVRMAKSSLLMDLLEIADDFDRAFEHLKNSSTSDELQAWFEGFTLTQKTVNKVLQKNGVTEIQDYEIFDPAIHEATVQSESPEHISGAIISVLQKGYLLNGELLRPAKVAVAK
jgi:molecular chaperone GrpE